MNSATLAIGNLRILKSIDKRRFSLEIGEISRFLEAPSVPSDHKVYDLDESIFAISSYKVLILTKVYDLLCTYYLCVTSFFLRIVLTEPGYFSKPFVDSSLQ